MVKYNLKYLGYLKIDKVFFEASYPILFTCRNQREDLFLCSCCTVRKNLKKWLVTQTTPEIILKLLKDEITIRDSFLNKTEEKYSIILENDEYKVIKKDEFDWSEESYYLPDPNEYMEAEEDEFEEEIEYYENINKEITKEIKYTLNYKQIMEQYEIILDEISLTEKIENKSKNNMKQYIKSFDLSKEKDTIIYSKSIQLINVINNSSIITLHNKNQWNAA